VGNRWVEEVAEVKQVAAAYFSHDFTESKLDRPTLDGINFNQISNLDDSTLVAQFLLSEIEDVISNVDGNKSPGPDGFNFTF